MKIGYARVSARWYRKEVQMASLKHAGCKEIWQEEPGPDGFDHAGFMKLLSGLNKENTLVTTRLTSVARSTSELLLVLHKIRSQGCHFRSLEEPWADTRKTDISQLITIIEGLAAFGNETVRLQAHEGMDEAPMIGIATGRPKKLSQPQILEALAMLKLGKSTAEISRIFNVSRSTISRLKSGLKQG